MILIEEILEPIHQGKSRPYYCRGSDGNHYCVKGLPRSSQGKEWVAAHLARAFDLPIPPFAIVEIPEQLLREAPGDWRELKPGPAFGSRWEESAAWMERGNLSEVNLELQMDLLVFDWWIKNPDRTAFNPNLIWQPADKAVIVIDHNIAFDADLTLDHFLSGHIFANRWDGIDLEHRSRYHARLAGALGQFESACATLPSEWSWHDLDETVESDLRLDPIKNIVNRCNSEIFWKEG